jgi:hypothetical protein
MAKEYKTQRRMLIIASPHCAVIVDTFDDECGSPGVAVLARVSGR